MKILIVSDTHGSLQNLKRAVWAEQPFDMMIHLGDVEWKEDKIRKMVSCPLHMIAGNNDFLTDLPEEEEFEIGKYHVFLTHGHRYRINLTEERLQNVARMNGADIVMYGHTHMPSITVEEDLITLNPGSLTYPRQIGRKPSYIVMWIDRKGEASFEIKYLDRE